MPKQKIHEGRTYSLIPLKEPDGEIARGEDGRPSAHWYKTDYTDTEEGNRLLGVMDPADYLLNDHEPHAYVMWDKRRAEGAAGEPGRQGFVSIALEVTPEWLRERLRVYDIQFAASRQGDGVFAPDPYITLGTGPLSWQDLNVLAKTARQARDDAFGKPE